MILSALAVAVLHAAPMADVWPFKGQRLTDGSIEYVYDLTALKASTGFSDAKEANGEEAVATFLKALPKQVTVRVPSGAPLTLTSGQGLELGPLSTSFASASDGALVTDDPLGKKPGARLLAPLDARAPKLLVGVEVPLLLARQVEDAALAAVELDTEALRRDFWSKISERALAMAKSGVGDVREGALTLSARVVAGASCGDLNKLPPSVKNDGELKTAVEAELARLARDGDAAVPPAPWDWSPELSCAWVRTKVLSKPFEQSRAGTAAVLVFLHLLAKDPKLQALYDRIRERHALFLGDADESAFNTFKSVAKGNAEAAVDDLNGFIDGLPLNQRVPPPLLSWPSTPFSKFLTELSGPERSAAMDELSAALVDGRVAITGTSWPSAREAALAALVRPHASNLHVDSGWRDRLTGSFCALQGAHRDASRSGLEGEGEQLDRSQLVLRLNVPPLLEVEPIPEAFERQARSLHALVDALGKAKLTGLRGLLPEQRRSAETIVNHCKRVIPILEGLAKVGAIDAGAIDAKQVAEARRFLANWRSEAGLSRDVRAAFAAPIAAGSERAHSAIVGISRRELRVGWASPPKPALVTADKAFVLNVDVEQRYIVPVLATVGSIAPHTLKPANRATLRQIVDRSAKDLSKLDGAIQEALHPEAVMGVESGAKGKP